MGGNAVAPEAKPPSTTNSVPSRLVVDIAIAENEAAAANAAAIGFLAFQER